MGSSGINVQKQLKAIDAGSAEDAKTAKKVEKLFKSLDKDKSGKIDGEEFQNFIYEVTKYVKADTGSDDNEENIRNQVKKWLDPDNSCSITFEELNRGIHKCVNADGD